MIWGFRTSYTSFCRLGGGRNCLVSVDVSSSSLEANVFPQYSKHNLGQLQPEGVQNDSQGSLLLTPVPYSKGLCPSLIGPGQMSDSVVRTDQLLRETSEVDRWKWSWTDFIGPLSWFPVATDRIERLSQKVDRGFNRPACPCGQFTRHFKIGEEYMYGKSSWTTSSRVAYEVKTR